MRGVVFRSPCSLLPFTLFPFHLFSLSPFLLFSFQIKNSIFAAIYFLRTLKKKEIELLKTRLVQNANIAIISHHNPDGDAVGSSLALYHFLKEIGCNPTVVLPNPFPDFLGWMPGSKEVVIAEREEAKAAQLVEKADIIFVLDMNAPHRAGKFLEPLIIQSNAFKVLIDHHVNPEIDCQAMLSDTKACSTCELLYHFIFDHIEYTGALTCNMAQCIYTGIITDTGSLTYSCNSPRTYIILSELIKAGINGEEIHRLIYDNYEESRIHLLGLSLSDRLKVLPEYATAYINLSQQDLKEHHYRIGDTEGFVNYGLTMKSVQFAAIFIQREDRVRISFRSKGNFDVNHFARTHFNGGGHRNASAAYHQDTLENTIAYFESLLPQYQEVLLLPYQNKQ